MMVPTFSLIRDSSTTRALGVTGVVDLDHPIPSDLSRLTVHAHSHCCWGEREAFSSPSGSSVISSCRVLKIHLASPDDMDSLTSAHSNYYNLDGDEPDPTPEGPFVRSLQCHILHHSLENACIDKLVLRGVPVIYGNVNPDLFTSSAFETVKEAVLVFDIDSMNSTNASTVDTYRTDCFECSRTEHEGDEVLQPCFNPGQMQFAEIGDLASGVPSNVEDLTYIFWSPKPNTDITPSCCRLLEPCPDCEDDCFGDSDPAESTRDSAGEHVACWQEGFWEDLAEALAPRLLHGLRAVTIVNASAIIPVGPAQEQHVRAITTGVATHDKYETKFREILSEWLISEHGVAPDKVKEYADRVHFKYMKDWLLSTEWEDVFSWSEVKPWLEFKRPALITDYFKPVDPNAVKWRKDMDPMERISLRHRRSTMKRTKPSKSTWG